MANSRAFIDHVLDLMRPAGAVTARPMFGGHGLYVDGMIVAIVVADTVYLKTDDGTRAAFTDLGLEPFRYATKQGDVQVTSYCRLPEEALESPVEMREWLRLALAAALRSASRAPAKRRAAKARPGAGPRRS